MSLSMVLKLDDRALPVRELQKALNEDAKAGLIVDGHFGAKTELAVKAFQVSKQLTADGIAGTATLGALGLSAATMDKGKLGPADYIRASERLGWNPWLVHALSLKETKGDPWLPDGRTRILYERHQFYRRLPDKVVRDRLAVSDRDICHSTMKSSKAANRIDRYVGGAGEYEFLRRAVAVNREVGFACASYGQFQVMGFNAKAMGYASASEFARQMQLDVNAHLESLVRFVLATPSVLQAGRKEDLTGVAVGYNGPEHAKNNYVPSLRQHIAQVRALYA